MAEAVLSVPKLRPKVVLEDVAKAKGRL